MCLALFPSRGSGSTSARQCFRPAGLRQAPGPLHSCSNSRRRRWFTPQGPGGIHCPAMPERVGCNSRIPGKKTRAPGLGSQPMSSITLPCWAMRRVIRRPRASRSLANRSVGGSAWRTGGSGLASPKLWQKLTMSRVATGRSAGSRRSSSAKAVKMLRLALPRSYNAAMKADRG